jgi:hypothetical protein
MPFPSSSLVTLRPDLAESFEQFDLAGDRQGFVGTKILTVIEPDEASGNFGIIPIDQLLQSPDTQRAPGSGYERGKFKFTPSTYVTKEHGWEEPIDDAEAKMYRNYFTAELIAANRAIDFVLRGMETRIVAALVGAGNTFVSNGYTAAASAVWTNYANATPMNDVENAIQKVYSQSGLWPNRLVVTRLDFRNLRQSQQIQNLIKYSGLTDPTPEKITTQVLAEVFGIEEVLVAGGTVNSANDGQTASPAPLWAQGSALVCRVAMSEDFKEPCIGRTFHWAEDGSTIGGTVETYREEKIRSDVVRVRNQTDEHILYPQAGFVITGTK